MKPFSLLIKPASADCNLRCAYCFYAGKQDLYPGSRQHRMSDHVLRELLKGYLGTDQPVYSLVWQGGEPTLMGTAFFEKVIEYEKQFAPRGSRLSNSLQTNATRIPGDLAALLGRYRFLAGCSLDGPPEVHDRYRLDRRGRGTQQRVLQGIARLQRHRVPLSILVLVTRANVHRPRDLYRYLTGQGFDSLQFIPCVEFDARGSPRSFSITGEEWGRFLSAVFEQWYPRDCGRITVRLFESVLAKLLEGSTADCAFAQRCDQYFVVEYNGDIYPCDFFVEPEYRIGNILDMSWEEACSSPSYQTFAGLKQQRHAACGHCPYARLCLGDCLKYRMFPEHDPRRLSWLCSGWQLFYGQTLECFTRLADQLRSPGAGHRFQAF